MKPKVFQCAQCPKSFTTKFSLKRHNKTFHEALIMYQSEFIGQVSNCSCSLDSYLADTLFFWDVGYLRDSYILGGSEKHYLEQYIADTQLKLRVEISNILFSTSVFAPTLRVFPEAENVTSTCLGFGQPKHITGLLFENINHITNGKEFIVIEIEFNPIVELPDLPICMGNSPFYPKN